jgi:hypothetical protein
MVNPLLHPNVTVYVPVERLFVWVHENVNGSPELIFAVGTLMERRSAGTKIEERETAALERKELTPESERPTWITPHAPNTSTRINPTAERILRPVDRKLFCGPWPGCVSMALYYHVN